MITFSTPMANKFGNIFIFRNPAPITQWHEALGSNVFDQFKIRFTLLLSCVNVQKHKFVHLFVVEEFNRIDGIPDIL